MNTNKKLLIIFVIALLSIQACSASSSIPNVFSESDSQYICDNFSKYDFLNLDQTEVQLWDLEKGPYTISYQEKLALFSEFGSDSASDTFCDYEVSEETQNLLDEVQSLIDDGDSELAGHKLEEYIHKLEQGIGGTTKSNKLAKPNLLSKEDTYKYIRDLLNISGNAEYWGNSELAQEALAEARDTFKKYGNETIGNVTDFKEAADIAGQADLLGLKELFNTAERKVREIAKKMVDGGFSSFDICSATKKDVINLWKLAALSDLLGLEGHLQRIDQAWEIAKQWIEIQEKRKNGEPVPECELNFIEFDGNLGNPPYVQVTGSIITCDGTNWEIEISLVSTMEDASFTGEVSESFTLDSGNFGEIIIPVAGTAKLWGDDPNEFQDPLRFIFAVLEENGKGQMTLSSVGNGTIETEIGPIPFTILPPIQSEIIPILYKDCGN